jgi:hypothetical protein
MRVGCCLMTMSPFGKGAAASGDRGLFSHAATAMALLPEGIQHPLIAYPFLLIEEPEESPEGHA